MGSQRLLSAEAQTFTASTNDCSPSLEKNPGKGKRERPSKGSRNFDDSLFDLFDEQRSVPWRRI